MTISFFLSNRSVLNGTLSQRSFALKNYLAFSNHASPRLLSRAISPAVSVRPSFKISNFTHQLRNYVRSHYYENPQISRNSQQFSRLLNSIPPEKVVWTLIGINGVVFLAWNYAISLYKKFGDSRMLQWMYQNFMTSPEHIIDGKWWTLLTATFSHKNLAHIAVNMFCLYSFALGVMDGIGISRFLILYLASGIASTTAHVIYNISIRHSDRPRVTSLGTQGASGSIMGLTTFFACAFPKARFLVFFVIPMPAWAAVGLFASYDIYRAASMTGGRIDSAGHIGGGLYGLSYWFLRVKPLLRAGRWKV